MEDQDHLEEGQEFDSYEPPEEEEQVQEEVDPLQELDDDEEKALLDNRHYWDTKDLAFAGRLNETYEFMPGRHVTLHTLDAGEQIYIGKVLDREFGKVSFADGIGSSYDIGLKIITLSLAIDYIDGEKVYEPMEEKEDVYSDELSISQREKALDKKSRLMRRKMQTWMPWVTDKVYGKYLELLERQEAALKLLPFFSDRGERLES